MIARTNQTVTLPHILVVDDDRRLRDLLQKFLVENGYMVTTVGDAAEARARLKGLTFDLIVLDVMMPGESGIELTQSLRVDNDVPMYKIDAFLIDTSLQYALDVLARATKLKYTLNDSKQIVISKKT